jgi:hypothetical protein
MNKGPQLSGPISTLNEKRINPFKEQNGMIIQIY